MATTQQGKVSIPQLEAAKASLVEQQTALEGNMSLWMAADDLVDRIDRLIKRIAVTSAKPLQLPSRDRRIHPTDEILRKMMADGTDLWIAELLAWTRNDVRTRRRELGVRPLGAGGAPQDRAYEKRRWMERWTRSLRELGLWPA
jgi:hypothetical protein